MTLRDKDGYRYGDAQADIRPELEAYAAENGYPATHFADAVCECEARAFRLFADDNEGAAVRVCDGCEEQHPIGDSLDTIDDADLEECECVCGERVFEITAAVALHRDTSAVRWLYLGCRCTTCGLVGCYADWKSESGNHTDLLASI